MKTDHEEREQGLQAEDLDTVTGGRLTAGDTEEATRSKKKKDEDPPLTSDPGSGIPAPG